MYLSELLVIMFLVLLIWFWLESMRVNEFARSIGARLCRDNNVQFLDDTVQLSKMWPGKNSHGQLSLLRHYRFEFSNSEMHRYGGEIILAGRQLVSTYMDAYRINEL